MSVFLDLKDLFKRRNYLNPNHKKVVVELLDGVCGLGEPSDHTLRDYLTDKQIKYIKDLVKRYRN
jgi:hypothetical protein